MNLRDPEWATPAPAEQVQLRKRLGTTGKAVIPVDVSPVRPPGR